MPYQVRVIVLLLGQLMAAPAASQAPAVPDDAARAQAFRREANALVRAGRIEEALTAFHRAIELFERDPGSALPAVLHEYGWVEFQRSGQEAADRIWERAEALAASTGDEDLRLRLSLSRALVAAPGPEKLRRIDAGLAEARRLALPEVEAGFLQRLGEQQMWDGRYLEAARTLRLAEATFRSANRHDAAARVLGPLARLYRKHGRADLAISLQRRAIGLLETYGNLEDRAGGLGGLVSAEAALGRTSDARRHLDEARTLVRGGRRTHDQIDVQGAFLDLQSGRAADAERSTRRIITSGDPFAARLAWHPHAEALLALDRPQEALDAVDRAIEFSIEPSELPRLLLLRARALGALGRRHDALETATRAIAAVEGVRSDLIPLDGLKQGYALFVEALFDFTIGLQVDLHRASEALDASEHGRSRAFLDLLRSRRDAVALGDIERTGIAGAEAGPDPDDVVSTASAPPGTSRVYVAIARRLESTVLVYWTGPSRSFAWSVTPEGRITVHRLPAGAAAIARLVRDALPRGAAGAAGPTRGDAAAGTPAPTGVLAGATGRAGWRRLHDTLIAPIASVLPTRTGSRLTIVPHGPIAAVPFAALLDHQQRYLVERFEVHYLPSGAMLGARPGRPGHAHGAFIVGAPERFPQVEGVRLPSLPGAHDEIRQIARRFPSADVRVALGRDARESGVRRALGDRAVLHFATHAVVSDETPLEGFLALQPSTGGDEADDGRLTVREIYAADVAADLVVLSACRTASGRPAADGIAGFARAFLTAGVQRVVGGLWDVPDLTSALVMRRFYAGGDWGTAAALRRAQIDVLRALRAGTITVTVEGRTIAVPEDPSLWAGFVLLGQP